MKKSVFVIAGFLALCAIRDGHAQVTESAALASNVLNFSVNIVTLNTSSTAILAKASTTSEGRGA